MSLNSFYYPLPYSVPVAYTPGAQAAYLVNRMPVTTAPAAAHFIPLLSPEMSEKTAGRSTSAQVGQYTARQQPAELQVDRYQSPSTVHHHKPKVEPKTAMQRAKLVSIAAGMLLLGALTHKLTNPMNARTFELISADWKEWARGLLGIAAVTKLNEAADYKPPPWLAAMQAVAVITPLSHLKTGLGWHTLGQTAVFAPFVAGIVQASRFVAGKLEKPLEEQFDVSPNVTRMATSIAFMLAGIKTTPAITKLFKNTGILEPKGGNLSGSTVANTAVAVCRCGGCTGAVCISEVTEFVGAFINSKKHDKTLQQPKGTTR